jgi:hypothetical protein
MPVFVNNYEISDDKVHEEMRHHPAPSLEEARREASHALIIRKLLLDAVLDRDMVTPEELGSMDGRKEEALIENLLEDIIQLPEADEATCLRYYKRNLNRFKDHTTGETLPFNMVQNHIETFLQDKSHQAAFSAYMDSLMDKAKIIGL